MVVRNCLQLLLELSRLEEKIAAAKSIDAPGASDEEIIRRLVSKVQDRAS